MSGYLEFKKTGNPHIDKLLGKISDAGDSFHHTSQWVDGEDFLEGKSWLDVIDEAAAEAAKANAATVTVLREAVRELYGDLADVMSLFHAEGEGSYECLERLAEQFLKETRMLAPFKSQSPYDNSHTQEEREAAYSKWRDAKIARGFSTLALTAPLVNENNNESVKA